jgi:hypothetical protein
MNTTNNNGKNCYNEQRQQQQSKKKLNANIPSGVAIFIVDTRTSFSEDNYHHNRK